MYQIAYIFMSQSYLYCLSLALRLQWYNRLINLSLHSRVTN